MNLLDRVLQKIGQMSADEVIQYIGAHLYREGIDRGKLAEYPAFLADIIFLIDYDTELAMDGMYGFLQNDTGQYLPQTICALERIGASGEAEILREVAAKSLDDWEWDALQKLGNRVYLYTDFDIWSLLEQYVEREKNRTI